MRFFLSFFLIFLAVQAHAATPGQPAFVDASIKAEYPWSGGFVIEFKPNEPLCKKAYGSLWREKCAITLGKYGDTAKGVAISPDTSGYWQWTGSNTLTFRPHDSQSIQPDRNYHVSLAKFHLPSFLKLNTRTLAVRTLPLSVRLDSLEFWIDPSQAARHRLAGAFEFNYPVDDTNAAIEAIAPQGAEFGKPEMVWNSSKDRLNISWQVKKLPENMSQAGILFKNFGQIAEKDGRLRYWAANSKNGGTVFHKNLPGKNGLFTIKKASIIRELDDSLDSRYVLELETSLYARPGDVQSALTVLELPLHNSIEGKEQYNWIAAPTVPAAILKKSRVLKPVSLLNDNAPRSRFRFAIPAMPGRYVLCGISPELVSASREKLGKPWFDIARAEKGNAMLGFLQPGNILPLAGKGIIDIYGQGLDEIGWEAQIVRDPYLALLAAGSTNAFASPFGNTWLNMDAFSAGQKGRLTLTEHKEGRAQFTTLNLSDILPQLAREANNGSNSSGLIKISLSGYKKGERVAFAEKLVLATDLGLVVKRNSAGAIDCFVQNMNTGKPVQGATVQILGTNGKTVVSAETDNVGHASFASLSGLAREAKPVAIIATSHANLAWLPLNDQSRELNYSEFATGGTHSDARGINVFIFGQRGMYRPGDTLHFGVIARNGDFSTVPENLPFYAEIMDPRGIKVWDKIYPAGQFGLAALDWDCPESALSGSYTFNVRTTRDGDILGSSTARVEEFQPETLKMKIELPTIKGWLKTGLEKSPDFNVYLQNLYGTPASGHKIRATLQTMPAMFHFPGYENYIFTDAAPFAGNGQSRVLPDGLTSANGHATMEIPQDLLSHSTMLVNVLAEGFEAGGGRATTTHASFIASPMAAIVGYKPLGSLTNLDYIGQDSKADLEFLALDSELNKTSITDITFSIAQRQYVTSLISDGQGGFRYDETPLDQTIKKWNQTLPDTGLVINLPTNEPGEYLLVARNAAGAILASIPYAVAGNSIKAPGSAMAGGKMRMRLDRTQYNAGDTINIALSLPYSGSGLITLERNGVEAFTWFQAEAGDSVWELTVPEDFEGKGYVVATFARSVSSPEIYMSPYTYSVASMTANMKRRHMDISVEAPEKSLPGQDLTISVSSAKPGKAILYAVDEGILQLTNYHLPKPLNALLADRALDVHTLQAMDLVMPVHARLQPRLSAFGGDMESLPFGARFQNPFKRRNEPPVAQWFAITDTGPEKRDFSLAIPDYYNGQLRIMAVGVTEDGAGEAAMRATLVAPLVLAPQTPLNLSPSDEFDGSLVISNHDKEPKNIRLSLQAGKYFDILKPLPETVSLEPGKETVCQFRLRALDRPGPATLVFHADDGENTHERNASLAIRPASPLRTSILAGMTDASLAVNVNRDVYDTNAHSMAAVSSLPLPLAGSLGQYLQAYPYGCTEQLVSRSFAQTLLKKWLPDSVSEKDSLKLLDATLGAIRARSKGNGTGLWPGSEPDLLLTAYVVDFLLNLRASGYGGADDLLSELCDVLAENCSLNESTLENARACAYAIWVLTREGRITTQLLENLHDSLNAREISGWEKDMTAVLIAASQGEMHIKKTILPSKVNYTPAGWFDGYAQYALHMAILARYFPDELDNAKRKDFFEATALTLNNGAFATFSACQGIRAMMAAASSIAPEAANAKIACADPQDAGETELLAKGALINYSTDLCSRYRIDVTEGKAPLFWQVTTTGYDRTPLSAASAKGIAVEREYLDQDGNIVTTPAMGQELTVRITARSENGKLDNCIITDLLPGGCEMVIGRTDSDKPRPEKIKFLDRREDRMLVFAELDNDPVVFSYRIRATGSGKFVLAPITAEDMYNKAVYGHGKSGIMEIAR